MAERIGIIGGGIAGLACAFRLTQSGHEVELFESSDQLGGLGTFFPYKDRFVDRFYHCIMPGDEHLLSLISDVGLADQLYWKTTYMGMVYEHKHYPFNNALDLLKFDALPLSHRIRLGFMSLLLPYLGDDEQLDSTPTKAWLSKLYGSKLWDTFWAPMFAAKFGATAASLPSLYLKKRMGREKNVGVRGYLKGGLHGLVEALQERILANNGQVHKSTSIESIEQQGSEVVARFEHGEDLHFDRIISTVPLSVLTRIAGENIDLSTLPQLEYHGVVNLLLFLDRPLQDYYWTPILGSETGFDGAVESSTLIDQEQYAGNHAVYLMKYTDRNSTLFNSPDTDIATEWIEDFLRVYSSEGITRDNIVDYRVFRAPFVEPAYPLNYLKLNPKRRLGTSSVYLATTAQVYPFITSWNSSTRGAEETLAAIAVDQGSQ